MTNFILSGTNAANNTWWIYVVLIGLVLVMMIFPMITNRKRVKEYNNMINSVSVGDVVRTVGGVIGRIVKITEKDGYKTILLETGSKSEKTVMEFDIASIGAVLKSKNTPATNTTKTENDDKKDTEPAKVEENAEGSSAEEIAQKVQPTGSNKTASKTTKNSKK